MSYFSFSKEYYYLCLVIIESVVLQRTLGKKLRIP